MGFQDIAFTRLERFRQAHAVDFGRGMGLGLHVSRESIVLCGEQVARRFPRMAVRGRAETPWLSSNSRLPAGGMTRRPDKCCSTVQSMLAKQSIVHGAAWSGRMAARRPTSLAPLKPHPRTLGWVGTTALAMGGSNQSLFLVGALLASQGSAAVPLLIVGLLLSWAAAFGWTELVLMCPNRVGGIAAVCAEAFRPYSPVLSTLTGVCYWWGWVPTCGLTAILSASAITQWYLPDVPVPPLAIGLVVRLHAGQPGRSPLGHPLGYPDRLRLGRPGAGLRIGPVPGRQRRLAASPRASTSSRRSPGCSATSPAPWPACT